MVGAGREGRSFQAFCERFQLGHKSLTVVDQLSGQSYLEPVLQVPVSDRIIVKSSGVPPIAIPAVYTTPTVLFFEIARQCQARIVGVTGTKGKSTTTALIHAMLLEEGIEHDFGGNIGIPMLDLIDQIKPGRIAILELSSFMLHELRISPNLSVITNILVDHLDMHGSMQNYHEAKRNIVRFQGASDFAVCLDSCSIVKEWINLTPAQLRTVSNLVWQSTKAPTLLGSHNQQLAALAREAANILGVSTAAMDRVLGSFRPLPHRLEFVGKRRGIIYINDSIASQPDAAIAGILAVQERFGGVGGLIVGGVDRGNDLGPLAQAIVAASPKAVALIGDTADLLLERIREPLLPRCAEKKSSMGDAVAWLEENCSAGDVILLAPGCPSYSLSGGRRSNSAWKNYEERGQAFRAAAQQDHSSGTLPL